MEVMPPVRIASAFFASPTCAMCGREWEPFADPVPTAYTVESIDADAPPEPVCDFCVERHDPELFVALLADRRRFYDT